MAAIFEENVKKEVAGWREEAKEGETTRTPWAPPRGCAVAFREVRDKAPSPELIKRLADGYLAAPGHPEASPLTAPVGDDTDLPARLETTNPNGSPPLWRLLSQTDSEMRKEKAAEETLDEETEGGGEKTEPPRRTHYRRERDF